MSKGLLGFALLVLLFVGCSSPNPASNPSPQNNSSNIDPANVELSWHGSDPQGDLLAYNVVFDTTNPPNTIIAQNIWQNNLTIYHLLSGTLYYWSVLSMDNRGNQTRGPVWRFTTIGGRRLQEVGFYDTFGRAGGIAASGNYAYVADGDWGLWIVNIANPAAPFEVGFYDTPGRACDVAVSGNYAYVADWYYFGIYDCSQAISVVEPVPGILPKAFRLAQNYPNPFNAATTIEYALPKTSRVKLELFDVSGRQVATLVNFNQNAGVYRVKLNATELPSGEYFYRLSADDFTASRALTVVK